MISKGKKWIALLALASVLGESSAFAAPDYSSHNVLIGVTAQVRESANNGAGITFAIIDTGIAAPWIGFQDRIDTAKSTCIIAGCNANLSVLDDNGHGTFVASEIIGSVPSANMYGIAPAAKAFAVKVLNANGSGYGSDLAQGIKYAADNGAQVINISIGPGGSGAQQAAFYASLASAVNYAARKKAIIVFAGGNSDQILAGGYDIGGFTNAAITRMIFTGSTNASKTLSSFSNTPGTGGFVSHTGKFYSYQSLWMMAQGEAIWGASNYSTSQYGYSYIRQMSGTSMAAPQAAGAAGLLAARWPHLLIKATLTAVLKETAQDLGAGGVDADYGNGLLRVDLAMRPLGTLMLPAGNSTIKATGAIVASGSIADSLKKSSSLKQAVAYDKYMRDFNIFAPKSVVTKAEKANASAAAKKVSGQTTASLRQFVDLGENGWVAFSGSPTSETIQEDPRYYLSLGQAQAENSDWYYGFAQSGTYIGFGRGAGAALAFNDARFGGDSAFADMETTASASLLSLVSSGDFSTVGYDAGHSSFAASVVQSRESFADTTDGDAATARGAALSYTMKPTQAVQISATSSFLAEKNMLLGSLSDGYLSLGPGATSASFGLGAQVKMESGWKFGLDAAYVTTDPDSSKESVITDISRLSSYSFSLGATHDNVTGIGDSLGFSVSKPLRVYGGNASLSVPVGVDLSGKPIIEKERVSLSPTGNETDIGFSYSRPLDNDGRISVNFTYRDDADNIEGEKDIAVMGRYRIGF